MIRKEWHTGTGKIIYDPYRPGLKKKNKWWAIVRVDPEIARYYRWWVNKEIMNPLNMPVGRVESPKKYDSAYLFPPSWEPHISIIRGEKPKPELMHLWKKYHGCKVTFRYSPFIRYSGDTTQDRPENYWFLDIDCPELMAIRKELKRPTNWNLHLTIGRTYE